MYAPRLIQVKHADAGNFWGCETVGCPTWADEPTPAWRGVAPYCPYNTAHHRHIDREHAICLKQSFFFLFKDWFLLSATVIS